MENFSHDRKEKDSFPLITIIIPTFNSAQSIVETLESIFEQKHPALEVIIVDANSSDRTVELAKNFHSPFLQVHAVTDYNFYQMLNCGISLASGVYITFLHPGDFYISYLTISHVVDLIIQNDHPDLVYGGCLVRKPNRDPKISITPFSYDFLRRGSQPAKLRGCFFRSGIFVTLGKFDLQYKVRSSLDLFCRFYLYGAFRSISTNHVLIDRVKRRFWRYSLFQYFLDSWNIIRRNFSFFSALRWAIMSRNWKMVFSKVGRILKRSFWK